MHIMQGLSHFACLPCEDSELFAFNEKIIFGAFLQKAFEQLPTFFNESRIFVTKHLLFRNRGHIASRPALVQLLIQCEKLVVSSLYLKFALGVLPTHGVLDHCAKFYLTSGFQIVHLHWVLHAERVLAIGLISLIKFFVEFIDV